MCCQPGDGAVGSARFNRGAGVLTVPAQKVGLYPEGGVRPGFPNEGEGGMRFEPLKPLPAAWLFGSALAGLRWRNAVA